jgi:DNA-binding transcriptional MocR family regulator
VTVPIDLIAARSPAAGAEELVHAVEGLIGDGQLAPGTRLPTIRALARRLGVSPTTVAGAWRLMVADGSIETHGRAGTFVARPRPPRRLPWLSARPGRYRVDLSTGTPDPELLPDISAFLADLGGRTPAEAASYLGPVVIPELEEAIRAGLPFRPASVTVVDGALDALDRLMADHVRRGSTVLVEDPCFPPIAEMVELHGGRIVPVATAGHGLEPDALRSGLEARPSVMVIQPRASNPTGVSMRPDHAAALAEIAATSPDTLVIEDDSCGDIASAAPVSLASHLPERTVHIRSFSKSHGPDLRLAAVCGPADVVAGLVERRRLGPIWSPRILQQVLAGMLCDPAVASGIHAARDTYAARRARLTGELARLGIETIGDDGFNVWLPVQSERDAMVALAREGIGVAPGSPFQLRPGSRPHVRVTVSQPLADASGVAAALAEAAARSHGGDRFVV